MIPMKFFFTANCLLADDEPIARQLVRSVLDNLGFKNIFSAEDGKKAIEIIKTRRIDLAIMDINMPVLSGIDVYKAVRRHDKYDDIIFVFVTAEAEKYKAAELIEHGIDAYILKPYSLKALEEKIIEVLNKSLKPAKSKELAKKFNSLLNKNMITEAQELYREIDAMVENKEDWMLLWLSAQLTLALGLSEQAIATLEAVVKKRPFFTKGCDLLASTLENIGQPEKAIDYYEKAQEISPGDRERITTICRLYRQIGEKDKSAALISGMKSKFTTSTKEYCHLQGEFLFAKDNIPEAIDWFQKALKLSDNDAAVLQSLAFAYIAAGNHSKAIEVYQGIIASQQRRTKTAKMYQLLGEMCIDAGGIKEAGEAFKKSYELDPSNKLVITKMRALMKEDGLKI